MSALIKTLAGLCLIRAAIQLILPEGSTRKLCDFALGLMETLTLVRALMNFLRGAV